MNTPIAQPELNPFASAAPEEDLLEAAPVVRTEHKESLLTRMIEHQTAKLPSNAFLFLSLCAMAVSIASEVRNQQRASRFFGMWVGPLLTMGVYNKMVKTFGAR